MNLRDILLFEDADLLAFDKPAGLAVQAGSGLSESLDALLVQFAKSNGKAPRLVHRLDRDTSGVLVVARTQPAAAFVSQAFSGRAAEKTYLALASLGEGPSEGVMETPLVKTRRDRIALMRAAHPGQAGALASRTRFKLLSAQGRAGLFELAPETGRMHQIRAHLAIAGRPILGDGKYGGLHGVEGVRAPRLMLHAWRLSLPHPRGGRLLLCAPPPPDFHEIAQALGLDVAAIAPDIQAQRIV